MSESLEKWNYCIIVSSITNSQIKFHTLAATSRAIPLANRKFRNSIGKGEYNGPVPMTTMSIVYSQIKD